MAAEKIVGFKEFLELRGGKRGHSEAALHEQARRCAVLSKDFVIVHEEQIYRIPLAEINKYLEPKVETPGVTAKKVKKKKATKKGVKK